MPGLARVPDLLAGVEPHDRVLGTAYLGLGRVREGGDLGRGGRAQGCERQGHEQGGEQGTHRRSPPSLCLESAPPGTSPQPWVSWSGSPFRRCSMAWYSAGLRVGRRSRKATMAQIIWSSWVLPQAGMPVIFTPCLITQNSLAGERWGTSSASTGGWGSRPAWISLESMPGAR